MAKAVREPARLPDAGVSNATVVIIATASEAMPTRMVFEITVTPSEAGSRLLPYAASVA